MRRFSLPSNMNEDDVKTAQSECNTPTKGVNTARSECETSSKDVLTAREITDDVLQLVQSAQNLGYAPNKQQLASVEEEVKTALNRSESDVAARAFDTPTNTARSECETSSKDVLTAREITDNVLDTFPEGVVFPFEIFDEIFHHSCASTRFKLSALNKFFHQRFHQWKDVTSVYISRQPIKQLPRATIIPQTYLIRTNVPAVASFSCSNLTTMAPTLFYAKQMLIESEPYPVLTEYNRIPPQRGFFGQFKNLEYLKIANVLGYFGIRYDLKELLGLPSLKVLHIRDIRTNFTLPDPKEIAAPIEQLRILIPYRNRDKLEPFLEVLSPTLTSLDFTSLLFDTDFDREVAVTFSPNNTAVVRELLPAVTSKCTELVELHIPYNISKRQLNRAIPLLKNLTKLKRISFHQICLTSLVNIIENLPPSCNTLIITNELDMNGEEIYLTHAGVNEKLFNGTNWENLRFQCNRIRRKIILQLGRLQGSHPKFLIRDITLSIQIIINASFEPKLPSNPHRIYLTDGVVLTREEFLNQMGILPADE